MGDRRSEEGTATRPIGRVTLMSRAELARSNRWRRAFADERKDYRYYELVEDTIREGFEYHYFAIGDDRGELIAIQPFFLVDQDLVAGVGVKTRARIDWIRRVWPAFSKMRTLMIGCVAGEGHLDGDEPPLSSTAELLAAAVVTIARDLRARLIVLKEFPAKYRGPFRCFLSHGFSRVPSLPMTRLNIDYLSFDDYMVRALNARRGGNCGRSSGRQHRRPSSK
jgi:hypothetical protein